MNAGMLLAKGGIGDRSFNDSAYSGLQQAQKKFGIRFETADFSTDDANLRKLQDFARQNFGIIIGIGFENAKYIGTVAKEFPDNKFAIIDTEVIGNNIASFVYREQEGDFLMGVLAAMLTQTKKIGIVAGADIPITWRIINGFKQGVTYEDKSIQVFVDISGTFTDPEVGKKLALAQYEKGIDIIYNPAGRTGLGIIEAAKQVGKLTIGTSGDQRYLAPGNVIGNRPKRVDQAVLNLVEQITQGNFTSGTRSLGLKEGGLELGPFDENLVSKPIIAHLEELKQEIINGKIQVEQKEGK